ncbi:MAG: hypothetical protein RLZZ198_712 [Bacteroidota bacterium]|jgi:hypothetical protein
MSNVVGIYQELEENEKVIESYMETAEFIFGKGAGGNDKESRVQGRLFLTNQRILILKFVSYGEEKASYDFSEMGNWYDVPLKWVKQIGHNTQTKKSWFNNGEKEGDKKGLTITIESPLERTVTQKSGLFGMKKEEVKIKDTYSLEIILSNVSALEMKIQGVLAKL